MFFAEILKSSFKSLAVIGLGKNTGKTFTLNQLLIEGRRLGLKTAITTIGVDGEELDSLFQHPKPKIMVSPDQIVANAKELLLKSNLDYEVLASTDIYTPLGEIILARILSHGQTILAGPSTRYELMLMKAQLEEVGADFLFVDGAVDRRSLAAPLATDTTVLAVGAEVAWDRSLLLEKFRHQYTLFTLSACPNRGLALKTKALTEDVKVALFSDCHLQHVLSHHDFFHKTELLSDYIDQGTETIYVRGMLTDEVLTKILANVAQVPALSILVSDSTSVFLSPQNLQRLLARPGSLQVLDPIHISAVTINPFNSSFGYVEAQGLLADVGQAVYPVPCFDLFLGRRYVPRKGEGDAIS